jgi:hypothetical protein
MTEFCKNSNVPQEDIGSFWQTYKTEGNKFYFEEQLMQLYGSSVV